MVVFPFVSTYRTIEASHRLRQSDQQTQIEYKNNKMIDANNIIIKH